MFRIVSEAAVVFTWRSAGLCYWYLASTQQYTGEISEIKFGEQPKENVPKRRKSPKGGRFSQIQIPTMWVCFWWYIGEICKCIWLIPDWNSSYVSVRYEVLHCFSDGQGGCGDLKSISMHWCHQMLCSCPVKWRAILPMLLPLSTYQKFLLVVVGVQTYFSDRFLPGQAQSWSISIYPPLIS